MKTREEQIAEMAKDLEQAKYWAMGTVGSLNKGFGGWYGVYMYNQGYRKQSDTMMEFVKRLKKELFAKCTYILTVDNPNDYDMKSEEVNALIDELAKEYGAEVEE